MGGATAGGGAGDPTADPSVNRAKVRARFLAVLGDEAMARNLETCVWNWTIEQFAGRRRGGTGDATTGVTWGDPRVRKLYAQRALSLAANLRNPSNPALREGVLSGRVPLKRLKYMTAVDMFPERYARKEVQPPAVPDGIYTCEACGSRKTKYDTLQTRSADEATTVYITCLECFARRKHEDDGTLPC
jgi:DNA-directed RNA polymerase subunit M/transcription elongation factor TFIIS